MKSINTAISKLKGIVTSKTALVAAAGAAALPMLYSAPAHAALTTDEQAMIDAVITKLGDIAGAIGSLVTANLGIAIALLLGAVIYGFVRKG